MLQHCHNSTYIINNCRETAYPQKFVTILHTPKRLLQDCIPPKVCCSTAKLSAKKKRTCITLSQRYIYIIINCHETAYLQKFVTILHTPKRLLQDCIPPKVCCSTAKLSAKKKRTCITLSQRYIYIIINCHETAYLQKFVAILHTPKRLLKDCIPPKVCCNTAKLPSLQRKKELCCNIVSTLHYH